MGISIVSLSPDADVMGGTPVPVGTRAPVQTLLDCLGGAEATDDFVERFPTVTRQQGIAFLEESKSRMVA